jgi:hypothetical protein
MPPVIESETVNSQGGSKLRLPSRTDQGAPNAKSETFELLQPMLLAVETIPWNTRQIAGQPSFQYSDPDHSHMRTTIEALLIPSMAFSVPANFATRKAL